MKIQATKIMNALRLNAAGISLQTPKASSDEDVPFGMVAAASVLGRRSPSAVEHFDPSMIRGLGKDIVLETPNVKYNKDGTVAPEDSATALPGASTAPPPNAGGRAERDVVAVPAE